MSPLCFFHDKPGDLFSRQFCGVTPDFFFAFTRVFVTLILHLFLPVRPRFSTILCKFAHNIFFPSGVTPWRVSPGAVRPLAPLVTPLVSVLNTRLHSAHHVAVKHLLHNGAVPTSSATSETGNKSDQNVLCRHSCPTHLANTYCRLTYLGFRAVRLVVPLLVVCRYCFSLSADVRSRFLSDASCQGKINPNISRCVQRCHSVYLHFRLLRELVSGSNVLLVLDVLCANVL